MSLQPRVTGEHSSKMLSRRRKLLDKYGLTLGQYEAMLRRQKGVCAVCERPPKKKPLNVDHDHETERVRGLLCFMCNKKIVGRHKNGILLRKAADYVDSTFDGRTIEGVPTNGDPDDVVTLRGGVVLNVRTLSFREQTAEGLAKYVTEPGIDMLRVKVLPNNKTHTPGGQTLVIFSAESWERIGGKIPDEEAEGGEKSKREVVEQQ